MPSEGTTASTEIFDPKAELAAFYQRHFDELCARCLQVSSTNYLYSPLNTLPEAERLDWIREGISVIIKTMLGNEAAHRGKVYFPRVSELEDTPFFGMADVLDTCECALLPDDGILPMLFADYADDPERLYLLVLEFRRAQNEMTKSRTRQQMRDIEAYVTFAREQAVRDERCAIEHDVCRRFYLALKDLQDKTGEVYDNAKGLGANLLCTQITQLRMMEADLLSEVLRISPDACPDFQRTERASQASLRFAELGLTMRETDVVKLAARGLTNPEISAKLGIAASTVKNYLASALSKLGLKNRTQLASFAVEAGLLGDR